MGYSGSPWWSFPSKRQELPLNFLRRPTRLTRHSAWSPCVVIALLLCGQIGVPVIHRVGKDSSVPFPCQDRGCSCQGAASCGANCCCFSKQERIAWAEQHGLDHSMGGKTQMNCSDGQECGSEACGSCEQHSSNAPADSKPSASTCCSKSPKGRSQESSESNRGPQLRRFGCGCDGNSASIIVAGVKVIQQAPDSSFEAAHNKRRRTMNSVQHLSRRDSPPVPPPQSCPTDLRHRSLLA